MGKEIIKNIFHDRHLGERAVIVCNGPSLNDMDLSFLKNEIVFGLNKIYLGFHRFGFYPKYYVAVNEKVLRQSAREIDRLTCVKFLSDRCGQMFRNNALTHILRTGNPYARFCKDITKGLEEGWTVTYAALQVAFFMGFKEVYIIGMDHRFEYSGAPNQASYMKGEDKNHFSSEYFSQCEWDNPDLRNSEKSYQIANETFQSVGRNIFDCTVGGACDIFEKRDYKKIFGLSAG
ncbi:6-hydroxymethylpterin diphosphokinase MptE-like protein [Microbulbifer sp. SAOS-129_SWC]|uniref:6-hydroxymethylpterin diphosphokinase MptE-like protein n=1 Tax=Microbulbifer sp. SAOS-129_SWC TaxID=3145235 RepID=UPI003217B8BE